MEKDLLWTFNEGDFPSIEIDVEYFKSLSKLDRIKYIGKLFFQEKDLGNRINLLNYIIGTASKVGKVFIKNREFQEYMKLLENGTRLVGVSAALGNMVKAKQTYRHVKNNEIAKLMGFPNGNYVKFTKMDVTQSMLEAFLEMTDSHKEKYKLKIDQIISNKNEAAAPTSSKKDATKGSEGEQAFGVQKMMISGNLEKDENKFGIVINSYVSMLEDDSDTTNVTSAKLFFPVTGSTLVEDELRERLEQIMFELYIEKVDTRKNYVLVNGTKLEIMERNNITANIRNIDIMKLKRSIEKTLEEGKRRGIVLVGEPGVGKTISVHKLINYFPNNLVFWVKPDSISTTTGIKNTFKIFEMFKNSIMVFDDIDSAPLTKKDEVTNEFLVKLDGTSKLTGFVIATVNDPSKLHSALINRPERFDEAIEVKTPQVHEEVYEILQMKANEEGYFTKKETNRKGFYEDVKGYITINFADKKNTGLTELYAKIISSKLTQVQVSGLIGFCHQYHSEISLASLTDAYESSIKSMACANMIAKKGRLIESDDLSNEANANLSRHSRF